MAAPAIETESVLAVTNRALKSFRLAPRTFIKALRSRPRVPKEEIPQIEQLAALAGPAPQPADDARHLVILSYLPLRYTYKVETLIARSLQERGWKVSVVANQTTHALAREYFGRALGAQILRIEDFLDFRNARSISAFVEQSVTAARTGITGLKQIQYKGAALGLSTVASLTASQPDGTITKDEKTYRRLRRLLRQSALLLDAADALYRRIDPSLVLSQEKGFIGTCETFYSAMRSGIDYVQWVSCHEPNSIMLKRYRPDTVRDHPFSVSKSTWAFASGIPWHERFREDVLAEFDRGYRSGDWFKYKKLSSDNSFADREELTRRLGLSPDKKTAVIYSHVLNDANLFYGTDLFQGGYEEWLVETVRAAAENPRVNWVLKLHPANVSRNARIGYTGEYGELLAMRNAFGSVPGFLKIVRPDEKISPFSFFGITDWGITVRGTIGVELPCFGIPVLTAGTGRYSNKGFTVDSETAANYQRRLRTIDNIAPLTEEQIRMGIIHAYLIFRGRPARCGSIFKDTYSGDELSGTRDLELLLPSIKEIIAHPQMRAVADFLVSSDEDFLDSAIRHGVEAA